MKRHKLVSGGRKGGKATVRKYGVDEMRRRGTKGAIKRWGAKRTGHGRMSANG